MLASSINQTRLLASEIRQITIQLRETAAGAKELLASTTPDTFLGRPHYAIAPSNE
jgi:hypothetical protein